MVRTAHVLLLGGLCLQAGIGCKHMTETRAINGFTAAVTEGDVERLRLLTSDAFERKALRLDEAAADLKTLRLPEGDLEIVEVSDEEDGAKLVKVESGTSRRTYHFRLVEDAGSGKWLIDDVYMNQTRDGAVVVKTVTEQMDLLLSVREFHAAWNSDERDRVLGVVTPEFRAVLEELPAAQLSQLVSLAMDDKATRMRISESTIDNEIAVITMPRRSGKTILTCRLLDDGWRVSDLAVEKASDADHLPSVLKAATALRSAVKFLDAYGRGDKEQLAEATDPKFFRGSLEAADLETVPLPGPALPAGKYEFKMIGKGASLIVPREKDVVTVSLARTKDDEAGGPVRFVVDEVTIYDSSAGPGELQEMRLSALFTGRAVMQIFAEALAARDLTTLQSLSTSDFNARVWDKLDETSVARMDVLDFEAAPPRVIDTAFKGSMTELTVVQGSQNVTYQLLESQGSVRVHDVIVPAQDRPQSLKTVMELVIPVRTFASAIEASELGLAQRHSSGHLNRLVWSQTDRMPPAAKGAIPHLQRPLRSIVDAGNERIIVELGDEDFGARVLLVTEHNQHVVDEIQLIAGPGEAEQAMFKKSMQQVLAYGGRVPGTLPAGSEVVPANFEQPAVSEPLPLPVPDDAAFLPPPAAEPVNDARPGEWSTLPAMEASLPHPLVN